MSGMAMNASKYEYQSEFARRYYGQGKADGVAAIVLKQLATRFGALPPTVATHIRSASAADLDRIAQRLLTAQTLDEALNTR
jgi:hypothetical protein